MTATMIFVLLSSCLAKEPSTDNKGKWGVSLSASGLSNLGIGLYQGGIGVKHWCSNGFALKSILGFGGERSVIQGYQGYTDNKTNKGNISLNFGTEFHFAQESNFSPYFYTGLNLTNSATTYYNSIPTSNPPSGTWKKRHTSTNSIGLDVAIGLEYLFSEHFSLSGEYQIGLSYQINKEARYYVAGPGVTEITRSPSRRSTTFGAKTSSLILTVYF